MRTYLTLFFLTLWVCSAWAQDPGMQAAQQAQMAAQAAQQANDQMMQAAQNANLAMQNAQQQATQNSTQGYCCRAAKPKFSVPPATYFAPVTLRMKDSTRGAVIYYTTDGWTPTAASTRYTGPITIHSTTSVQAVAISPYGGRSRIASAVYTMKGTPVVSPDAHLTEAAPKPDSVFSPDGKLLLSRGTPVSLVFAADVSSKTAEVGDTISVTLAEDLKAGNVIVAKKGTPSVATVTAVDPRGRAGLPGEVFFQVDSLQAGSAVIKLHGGAAKEGQDKEKKAIGLMFIPGFPVGGFVRGKDAEIRQGALFTAFVDADIVLPPAN
jgi:Chitobiase/beta-hexosaminidase C-terminal domain